MANTAPRAVYVHIPFCARRCRYCAFASSVYDRELAAAYLDALEQEMDARARGVAPATLYLGGGTPTALGEELFERLLALLADRLDLSACSEFTCEANPASASMERLLLLRRAGANRLSLGVQSFSDRALKLLGRSHTARQARAAVARAREAGFDNLSLDLIHGLPGQSPAELDADLDAALALEPAHISSYGLTWEEGTDLTRLRDAGRLRPLPEEAERTLFDRTRKRLREGGLPPYEISNFARPGRACAHNRAYWTGAPYLGLGAAAHSYVEGERFSNCAAPGEYLRLMASSGTARVWSERLDPAARARERAVISLRLTEGLDCAAFLAETGTTPRELFGRRLERLVREGWLLEAPGRLRLSEAAVPVSDAVLAELL